MNPISDARRHGARIARLLACVTLFSLPVPAAAWNLVEGQGEHGMDCLILDIGEDTSFMIRRDGRHYVAGTAAVMVMNTKWSIRAGDRLGTVSLNNSSTRLEGEPVAQEHGFFFHLPFEALAQWIAELDERGFSLVRNGKEIGHYPTSNIASAFARLNSCAERNFADDPFAD